VKLRARHACATGSSTRSATFIARHRRTPPMRIPDGEMID
jgi:hypothetical protein